MPFVIPLLHNNNNGIFVDTILLGSDKVSVIFSFTELTLWWIHLFHRNMYCFFNNLCQQSPYPRYIVQLGITNTVRPTIIDVRIDIFKAQRIIYSSSRTKVW